MYLAVVFRPLLQAQTAFFFKTEYFKLRYILLCLGFFSVRSFTNISTFVDMTQPKVISRKILRFLIFLATVTLFLNVMKAMRMLQKLTVSLVQGAECGQRSKWENCKDATLQGAVSWAAVPGWRAVLHATRQAVQESSPLN